MKYSSIVILLLSFTVAQAQIGDNINFNKAKRLMSLDAYEKALPILDSLKQHNPKNHNLDFLIGKCHANKMYDKSEAIPFLEDAVKHSSSDYKNTFKEEKSPEEAHYYLAKAYLLNYQLDKAINTAEELVQKSKDQDLLVQINRVKESAQNAKEFMLFPIKIELELIDSNINSKFDDYTALINSEETVMVLTSRREGGIGNLKTDEGKYYEDIYISYKKGGNWQKAENIGGNINTNRHDAAVAISPDGKTLMFYRDDFGIGNLYISKKDSLGWSKAQKLSQNINSKFNETHASFSHDGQKLYFVSDIKDGYGGKDIYFSNKLPNGEWGYPQNLGNNINTEFDEDGVFLHPDGQKLYFSSKGLKSMGAYEIYVCELIGDRAWSKPRNMGYPINTTGNDMFAVFSSDNKRAYYSANKKDGMGGFDIYKMNLMSLPERNTTIVKGSLRNASGEIIIGKSIKVTDAQGKIIGKYKTNKEGLFTIVLQQGQTYNMKVTGLVLKSNALVVPDDSAFFITQNALLIDTLAQEK